MSQLGDAGEGYFIVPRHTLADFDDGLESGDETVDTSLILSPPNDDDSGPVSEVRDPWLPNWAILVQLQLAPS